MTSWLAENDNQLRPLARPGLLKRVLGSLSIFTMVMTVPQKGMDFCMIGLMTYAGSIMTKS